MNRLTQRGDIHHIHILSLSLHLPGSTQNGNRWLLLFSGCGRMRGSNDSIPFVSIYMSYTCMKDRAWVIMVQCWFHHGDENGFGHHLYAWDSWGTILSQWDWPAWFVLAEGPIVDPISQEILSDGVYLMEKILFCHGTHPLENLAAGGKICPHPSGLQEKS